MNPMPMLPSGFYRDPMTGDVGRWDGSRWRELPPLVTPPAYALPAPVPPSADAGTRFGATARHAGPLGLRR